jgi:hypothetical protein
MYFVDHRLSKVLSEARLEQAQRLRQKRAVALASDPRSPADRSISADERLDPSKSKAA